MQTSREPSESRWLNLGDLMILVAAIAVGLGLHRFSEGLTRTAEKQYVRDCSLYLKIDYAISDYVMPSVIAGTFGGILVHLRRSRRSLKHHFELPRMAAMSSAMMVLILSYSFLGVQLATGSHPGFVTDPVRSINATHPGWAVAGAWLTLLLSGRWQSDRSWADRLGIGVGLAWLSLVMMWCVKPFLTR